MLAAPPGRARSASEIAFATRATPSSRSATGRRDAALIAALTALTLIAQWHLLAPETLISLDSASQFYPWYAFLGQNLMAGHVPGWNPAMFSGTPFAANPLSGWTYLPAMLFFGALPLAQAAKAYLIFHPLLAAWSTYAFARTIGLGRLGAFVAALAYANTGFLQIQNLCCFAFASVYTWLPLALLGAEGALRSIRLTTRACWWGLAGLGISQIVAAWLGQGTYYAALIVGGYIVYRTVLVTSAQVKCGWRALVQHEAGVFVFGAALAAAGLVPRVEFNALSNLAGGYMGPDARVGGLRPEQWVYLALPGFWYVGASTLLLAAAAPWIVRRRLGGAIWYFGATSLIALILSDTFETPLDQLLYHLLPGFASLHPHAPERILTIAYLGPALLAGAAISVAHSKGWWISTRLRTGLMPAVVASLVVLVVAADLAAGGSKARSDRLLKDPFDGIAALAPVDLSTYYRASDAAAFLQVHRTDSRYFGYAPDVGGQPQAYTLRFLDPSTANMEVNNRALPLGLQDVQGYDASHLRRYDSWLAVLNGQSQDYHNAEVFPRGLSSPLLDLLNARYVIVPAQSAAVDSPALERFPDIVYQDRQVRILENPSAFKRAWIVHAATQGDPESHTALTAIAGGQVDAHKTALLEEVPPALEVPSDPTLDQAVVTSYEVDRVGLRTSTTTPGLVVLSEIYYPAWHAYVDGKATHLYVADGALRAVAVPAGEHSIELRLESRALAVGILISSAAVFLLAILLVRAGGRVVYSRGRSSDP
jgi:hypothetical protein